MKFHTLNIILFNLTLLFNKNVVYCGNTDGKSSSSIQAPIAPNNDTNVVSDNTDLFQPPSEVIKLDLLFVATYDKPPVTKEFGYRINPRIQEKLSDPNKIDSIKFNNYLIEFDGRTKFPIFDVKFLSIYTCEHNNPILIALIANSNYYYYSLNNNSNKWINYRIQYDSRLVELVDVNDAYFYSFRIHRATSYRTLKVEDKGLAEDICHESKCKQVDISGNNSIFIYTNFISISDDPDDNSIQEQPTTLNGITSVPNATNDKNKSINMLYDDGVVNQSDINSPDVMIVGVTYVSSSMITPLTILFQYKIYGLQQRLLTHINKIEKIVFSNYVVEFDNNAELPFFNVEYLYIFTCKHFNPMLIEMYCNSKYYYYSFNPQTNKWTNHKIKYDTRYTEFNDVNGISYYANFELDDNSSDKKQEDKEITNELCNEERCVKVNKEKTTALIVYLRPPGTRIY